MKCFAKLMLNRHLCVDTYQIRVDDCMSYQRNRGFETIIHARAAPKTYLIQKCLMINYNKDQHDK